MQGLTGGIEQDRTSIAIDGNENLQGLELCIFSDYPFFAAKQLLGDGFLDDLLDGRYAYKLGMFAARCHDDGIVLDIDLPIYRRHQIKELVEIRDYAVRYFEIELVTYPTPEVDFRDRRKIALEADNRRSRSENPISG